jgi:hypothetical protein
VLVTLVVGLALLLPLIVRDPVLRHLVQHQSESLCGSVSVAAGHLGWGAVPAVLRGRPVSITLEQVRLRTLDGHELLGAARVRASIEIHARPWHVVVDDAAVERGSGTGEHGGRSIVSAGRGAAGRAGGGAAGVPRLACS